ncbi:MAG: cyclic nucleotide-binding domain-containing protein [Silicimonas sp.]|nr:cyclic nucleotide-binding domain-containing protein [Silicimonas sp.]
MAISTLSPPDLAVVKSTILCGPMSEDTLHSVLAGSTLNLYERNDCLFEAQEPASKLYLVLDGWVKLSREESDGSNTLIAAFTKGDSIAEAAAVLGEPYPATAQAMSNVRALVIEGTRFLENMQSSKEVLGAGLAAIYRQLHSLVDEVELLKSRTIRQRLIVFLLKTSEATSGPSSLRLPYDKSLIAAKIGTSPENLSRTFAELREFGVTVKGREAMIADIEDLRALLRR